MRRHVTHLLHLLIDGDGYHLGLSRDVATHHQDHAKLAHCMGKAQHNGRKQTASCLRQHNGKKGFQARGTQHPGGLAGVPVNGLEPGL